MQSVARFGLEQYNEALSDIKKAIKRDVKNPLYHSQEGFVRLAVSQLYIKWHQPDEAKNQYKFSADKCDEAINLKKNYWPALYCRSIACYLNDDIDWALQDADNAKINGKDELIDYMNDFVEHVHEHFDDENSTKLDRESILKLLTSSVVDIMKLKDYNKK